MFVTVVEMTVHAVICHCHDLKTRDGRFPRYQTVSQPTFYFCSLSDEAKGSNNEDEAPPLSLLHEQPLAMSEGAPIPGDSSLAMAGVGRGRNKGIYL